MNIYCISPVRYKSLYLFDTFTPHFKNMGHEIVSSMHDADIVFFDLHNRLYDGHYDHTELLHVIENIKPVVFFDFWDYGAMNTDRWFGFDDTYSLMRQWEWFYYQIKDHNRILYFMRKMDKREKYPPNVYPIEVPLLNNFQLVSEDELFNREYDVCFIGNTSPTRRAIVDALLRDGRIKVRHSLGNPRMENIAWLSEHSKSKFFIESCGGGFGSERMHQLITVSPMLRTTSQQRYAYPFTHEENCFEINASPDKEEVEKLVRLLKNKEKLYDIYQKGAAHMRTYYSESFRANYILEIMKSNNFI